MITEEHLHRIIEATIKDVLADSIPDTNDRVPYTDSDEFRKEFYPKIRYYLSERSYDVLIMRICGMSFDEIGVTYGLSAERIRSIYKDAIEKLRNNSEVKNSLINLLSGDYNKEAMNRINHMKYNMDYSPDSSDRLIRQDFVKTALYIYKYMIEWNQLYGKMSDEQFIVFFEESNVSLSKSGLLDFFRNNFSKLYRKTKRSMSLLDKFDRVFAYRITNEYQKFYNKWREIIKGAD